MRSRKWWMMVVVLAAGPMVGACGDDSLAPMDLSAEVGAKDLDVWVPPLVPATGMVESRAIEWPADWKLSSEASQAFSRGSRGTSGESSAYIGDVFLTAGWNGDELWYEYGMMGIGTGYSMTPTVRILKPDGSELLSETGTGIKLTLSPIPVSFTPAMREVIRTGIWCGLTANISVEFRSFTGINVDAFNIGLSASRTQRTATSQPGCAPTPPGAGAPGGGSGGYITYCRYDAWYTSWGQLIAIEFLGCTTSPINAA